MNIFLGWLLFAGEFFQERLVFKEEYFSRVIFFKGWTFFRYTHSLNILLSHNLLGVVYNTLPLLTIPSSWCIPARPTGPVPENTISSLVGWIHVPIHPYSLLFIWSLHLCQVNNVVENLIGCIDVVPEQKSLLFLNLNFCKSPSPPVFKT